MAKKSSITKVIELKANHYIAVADHLGNKKLLGLVDIKRLLDLEHKVIEGNLNNVQFKVARVDSIALNEAKGTTSLLTLGRLIQAILGAHSKGKLDHASLKLLIKGIGTFNGIIRKRSPDKIADNLHTIANWPEVAEVDKAVLHSFVEDFLYQKARLFVRKRTPRYKNTKEYKRLHSK